MTPRTASTSGPPTRCRRRASRATRPGPSARFPPLGGLTWNTISHDPELGLIYLGTGQPTPWASTLRGPGDALYTNSILALDIDTGELEWYFQVVPSDNWDLDATGESMLVDLVIGGVEHKALIETSKIGWGVVLDRETGRFLNAFRTGYDNIITGWTDNGSPIFNPAQIPTLDDVDSDRIFEVCPHLHGTRNLNAPSFNAETGLYYVGINNACMDVTFVSEEYRPGRVFRGMGSRVKQVPGYDYIGEFVAFNPITGDRAWTYRADSGAAMTASALATAGGNRFRRDGGPPVLRARRRERRSALGDAAERRHLGRPGHVLGRRPPVPRGRRRRPHRPGHLLRGADRVHAAAGQRRDVGVRAAGVARATANAAPLPSPAAAAGPAFSRRRRPPGASGSS